VLNGAQNTYRFGLFAALRVPMGTSTKRLDRRRHRADNRPGAAVTSGLADGWQRLRRLGAGSWVIRPSGLRGLPSGARLLHQLPPSRTRRPGRSLAGWTMIEVFDTTAARSALARRKLRCPGCGQALKPRGRARERMR
jgi:hypothetical protein